MVSKRKNKLRDDKLFREQGWFQISEDMWRGTGEVSRKLRFVSDVNVPALLVDRIRKRGTEVRTAQELGFDRLADDDLLRNVSAKGYVLITLDADFWSDKKIPLRQCGALVQIESANPTYSDSDGFELLTRHTYPGGVPSSSFQIVINETPVDLGDEDTPLDQPSFRNTLSAGDKSTLALAFFLAELEHDRDRATRIVVFDDPFNSQDAFRKDHTVEKIRKCGDGCAQVIVLSHDQGFLKRVWDRLAPQAAHRKCLQLSRIGVRNTAVTEWDIERATQQRFKADLKALGDYYNAGEGHPREIVSKLRPVLETYCRNLYPSQFPETDMLGTMITKIRQAGPTHDLASEIDDIEAINIYTRRYHHGESAQPATEEINDTELQGFVRKTLAITGYS